MDTKETDSRKETHEQMKPRNGTSEGSNITRVLEHSNNTNIVQGDKTESQDVDNGNKTGSEDANKIGTKESLPSSETKEEKPNGNGASADTDKTSILQDSDNNDSVDCDKTDNQDTNNINENDSFPSSKTQEKQRGNKASADNSKTGILKDSDNFNSEHGNKTGSEDTYKISTNKSLPRSLTQETEQYGNGASADVDKTYIVEDLDNFNSQHRNKKGSEDTNKINTNESLSKSVTQETEQYGNGASADVAKTDIFEDSDNFYTEHGNKKGSEVTIKIRTKESLPSSEIKETEQHGNSTSADFAKTGILDDSGINDSIDSDKTDSQESNNIRTNEGLPRSETQEEKQHKNGDFADVDKTNIVEDSDNFNSEHGNKTGSEDTNKISTNKSLPRSVTQETEQYGNGASADNSKTDIVEDLDNFYSGHGNKKGSEDTNKINTNESLPRSVAQETEQYGNCASADNSKTDIVEDSGNFNSEHGDKTGSEDTNKISTNKSLQTSETQETEQHRNGTSADINKTDILDDSGNFNSEHGNKTDSQGINKISTNEGLRSSEPQEEKQHRNGDFADKAKTGIFKDSDNSDSKHGDSEHGYKIYSHDINTSESHLSSKTQEEEQHGKEASAERGILEDSDNNDSVDGDTTGNQDTKNIRTNESLPSSETEEEKQHRNGPADVDESGFLENSDINDSEHGIKLKRQDVKEIKSNEKNSMKATQESERLRNRAVGDSDNTEIQLKINCSGDQEGKNMNLDESHQSEKTQELEQDSEDTKKTISIENAKTGNHDTQALISPESEKVEEGGGEDNNDSQISEIRDRMEVSLEETTISNDEERIARSEEETDKILSRSDQGNITTESKPPIAANYLSCVDRENVITTGDSLSQERIDGEERLKEAQQKTEDLLKHHTTEKEQLHAKLAEASEEIEILRRQVEEQRAKLGEANEEIENLRRQVEEQSDSLSQERINGENAQPMTEELLKYQSTEEELLAKLMEAKEEIENLRRQVEEQRGMRYHVQNQETDRLPHDNTTSGWTQETNNLQDREDLESTSYERKIRDLKNELRSQQEIMSDYEAQIEQLTKENNDKSDENCGLVHRNLELETAEKQLNEIKSKASEEEGLRKAEIEKLQKELDSMNESLNQERNIGEDRLKEIEKFTEDIHNLKTREEIYQQRLEEASKEIENLKRQNEKQNADNGGILHKYLEEEKTAKNYKVSLEVLGQEKEELESQLHYTKEKLAQTERELIVTKEEHKAEKSKLEEAFQRSKAQSSQEIEKQHQQINKLKDDIRRLETIFAHTTNVLEGKKVENKKMESELNRIKRELEGIKNEKTQLEDLISRLSGEINTRDTRIMKMNGDLTMKEAEKTYANECMQKAVQRQQEMAYQLSTLQRVEMEKNQAEQDKKSLLDENTRLRASLKEVDDFRNYLKNYYKLLQDTQLELQKETEKNRHFNELLSSNGHRMENMMADLRNYRSMAESYRKSLEEKKDDVHGLQRNIDKLTYENEKLKEERDKYHQESFELRDRCQGLTEELEQSRNESRELREQAEAADGTSENRSFPNQGPPNVSFQGQGFFAHGTGISGSRRN